MEDWADWLAAFLGVLEIDDAHIAGLSWGGGLALTFTHRHPDLVRSLVLMSAYAGWAGSLPEHEVQRRLGLAVENSERPVDEWIPGMLDTLPPSGSAPWMADELTAMLSDSHPAATQIALTAFAEADLRAVLPEIEVPTLVLYGELDVRSPEEVWAPIHEAIPHSRLVVIPRVGHMIDLQASERCNAEIRAFIADVERDRS